MRWLLVPAILVVGATFSTLSTATEIAKSGPFKVSLIEVYSSEGCSSCPPAEEWVSKLSQSPELWKDFVPVVFHVDYWDYLGWKDKFSDPRFSERQRVYAESWRNGSVYTPGFVLNGKEWRDWYGQDSFRMVNKKEEADSLLIEKIKEDIFAITFKPKNENGFGRSYIVHAAILGFGIVSDVKAGENAGRHLKHDFTVIDYVEKDMGESKNGLFQKELSFKVRDKISFKKLAISAWVSEDNSYTPIQAAGGYLVD